MLRASTSLAKRLQFRALIKIPKTLEVKQECYFKGKNMARCFHFHFALKTEKEVATGAQGAVGPPRSVPARLAPRARNGL